MDLFGTYLPCHSNDENEEPHFSWSDGVLLQAVKNGWWVILDELNLASQAVLEGLNALLDHRSAVFIPELGEEFTAADEFRVFACQNPLLEGGGRKGLPRSFLNRFTKVRIEPFGMEDLLCIAFAVCPSIDKSVLEKMVHFVGELHRDVMVYREYGTRGSPWEFNLRDVLRWARFMEAYQKLNKPCEFIETLFTQRMRRTWTGKRCISWQEDTLAMPYVKYMQLKNLIFSSPMMLSALGDRFWPTECRNL
ncbi:putative Midasin [Trypanosoma cruzi]|uniref:Putative Midasin n=1 Tax=Trypanosoma cruzi TaxID=5693 RepID=A0A2V2W536_TRYCR|nr:putative Midasin [Trypanosoma cruzi]